MRNYILVGFASACILLGVPSTAPAGFFNAQGQFVGTVSPQITALLAQFPAGGPGLRAAIAQAVEANPSLAADAVFAAQSGNASQKEAIGSGLADAASFFAKSGSASALQAQAQIQAALTYADAGTQAGVSLSNQQAQASTSSYQGIPGFNSTGATTSGCVNQTVSPSRPSSC
jgi:hypothetical protein